MHQSASTFPFNAQGLVQHVYENSVDINIHSTVMSYKPILQTTVSLLWQEVSEILFFLEVLITQLSSIILFQKFCFQNLEQPSPFW